MAGSSLIGNLAVDLTLETAAFFEGVGKAQKELSAMGARFQKIGAGMADIGAKMSLALTAPFAALVATSIPAAKESMAAMGQVNAALASMGPVAGRTSEQLQETAKQLMQISTFDDDEILGKVTANLLTFGNVSGEVFDRAQLAAVNLSARLGQDLQSSAIQLGKALNDPVKGITALQRVGVSFTEQQREQIKAMVDAGNTAGAQKMILGELERQYGGAAKALRDATPSAAIQNQWDDLQERIGTIALQVLPPLLSALEGVLQAFNDLNPTTQTFIVGAAALAAGLGPVITVIGGMVSAFGVLLPLLAPLSAGFATLLISMGPILPIVAAVAAAGALIYANWDKIGPMLSDLWGYFEKTLGPPLRDLVNALSEVLSALWQGPLGETVRVVMATLAEFGGVLLGIFGAVVVNALKAGAELIAGILRQLGTVFSGIAALLRGDWSGAWNAARDLVVNIAQTWMNVIGALAGFAPAQMQKMVDGIRAAIVDRLEKIWAGAIEKVEQVKKAFYDMYDAVVGHSYVPDMVDGIATEIARLASVMVQPVAEATQNAGNSFKTLGDQADGVAGGISETWDQMARNILNTIDGLVKSIKKGNVLDILGSIADAVSSIAGTGLFGGKAQRAFSMSSDSDFGGFRANGGPVIPGKSYVVGEKGPEWFTPTRAGHILPSGQNDNGRAPVVQIVPSAYFDAVVDQRAGNVAAPLAMRGGLAGADLAQERIGRARRNRIP